MSVICVITLSKERIFLSLGKTSLVLEFTLSYILGQMLYNVSPPKEYAKDSRVAANSVKSNLGKSSLPHDRVSPETEKGSCAIEGPPYIKVRNNGYIQESNLTF